MTNLNPEICRQIRKARLEAKLSQSVVAAEVGCKQNALSMFEQGDGTKLNDEVIEKLCAKFNVSLKGPESDEACAQTVRSAANLPPRPHTGFCPNAFCPSHLEYFVDGRRLLKPDRTQEDPVGGKFCAICGEILERRCPNCGAAVHDGAICSHCGEPYIVAL